MNGVGCSDCHKVHADPATEVFYSATCMSCHAEVSAQFNYPSHHPVREGHMSCTSCHTPHGSSIGMLREEERTSELCLTCHTAYAGPFIFEHEPVAEGCDTCHSPHGGIADNLLVQNEPFICLQCHEMHFHAGLEGEEGESSYVQRYDPDFDSDTARDTYPGGMVPNLGPTSYKQAFTTKCTQCHTAVHGTDLPSQTVGGAGRGMMR
jgi:DmsE family decaheme c-type cytochrome